MNEDSVSRINEYLLRLLKEDFESPDPETRKKAIYTLGRLGRGARVIDELRLIAAHDDSPQVRYTAKKALNYWMDVLSDESPPINDLRLEGPGGELDLEKVARVIKSGESAEQLVAVVEVVQHGDERAIPLLLERLETEEDPWVLSMLVKAVGAIGEKEHVALLIPFLQNPNTRVVANTIEALEMMGGDEIVPSIIPFLDSEDNRVRANAVRAVHRFEPERAVSALRSMACSKKEWMRDSAIYCLKILEDESCEDILVGMLRDEPSRDIFERILDVLSMKGGRKSVGALKEMLGRVGADERKSIERVLKSACRRLDIDSDSLKNLSDAAAASGEASRVSGGACPVKDAAPASRRRDEWDADASLIQHLAYILPALAAAALLSFFAVSMLRRAADGPPNPYTQVLFDRYTSSVEPTRFHNVPVQIRGTVVSFPAADRIRLKNGPYIVEAGFSSPIADRGRYRKGDLVTLRGTIRGRGITGDIFFNAESLSPVKK